MFFKQEFRNGNISRLNIIFGLIEDHILLFTAFFSLLISAWLFVFSDIISRDSILYIEASQAYLEGGISDTFKIYSWPFYSVLIASFHNFTSLSLEHSAYLLSAICELLICVIFVKIYAKIAFHGAHNWVAAVFILSFEFFNSYRVDIIRDYGFWAFSLLALYHFILYYQNNKKIDALLWQASISIAILFRPEAIVFAILAPLYFIIPTKNNSLYRIKNILTLNSIFIFIGIALIILFFVSGQFQTIILNNLPTQIHYFSLQSISQNFNLAAENFVKYVLPFDYSARYAYLILASGLITMILVKIFGNFTLIYSGIFLTGIYNRWIEPKKESKIIYYFASLSFLILLVFVSSRLFLSSRYTVFLILLLGLVFVQYLDYLIYYLHSKKKFLWLSLLFVFIFSQFLDGIIITAKKLPIKYISQYTYENIPLDNKIACNDKRHVFYTHNNCKFKKRIKDNFNDNTSLELQQQGFDYLLIWVNRKNSDILHKLENDDNLDLIKKYTNNRNDSSLLYKINKRNSQ